MNKNFKSLKANIKDQSYLNKITKQYPKIKSGRKNYYNHYIRVLKNILLTKFFERNINDIEKIFLNKLYFKYNKKSIKIESDKKNKYI